MTSHVFQSSVEEVFLGMYSRSGHLQHVQGFRSFPNLQGSPHSGRSSGSSLGLSVAIWSLEAHLRFRPFVVALQVPGLMYFEAQFAYRSSSCVA